MDEPNQITVEASFIPLEAQAQNQPVAVSIIPPAEFVLDATTADQWLQDASYRVFDTYETIRVEFEKLPVNHIGFLLALMFNAAKAGCKFYVPVAFVKQFTKYELAVAKDKNFNSGYAVFIK